MNFESMGSSWSWTYGSWIYNYLAISVYHHKSCEFESHSRGSVLDTTLCDKVCQRLERGWWFLRVLRFPPPIKLTASI